MEPLLFFKVMLALFVIGGVLFGLRYALPRLGLAPEFGNTKRRLLTIVESRMLSQGTAVHVIKVLNVYYVVGSSPQGVSTISELPASDVEMWLANQRIAP